MACFNTQPAIQTRWIFPQKILIGSAETQNNRFRCFFPSIPPNELQSRSFVHVFLYIPVCAHSKKNMFESMNFHFQREPICCNGDRTLERRCSLVASFQHSHWQCVLYGGNRVRAVGFFLICLFSRLLDFIVFVSYHWLENETKITFPYRMCTMDKKWKQQARLRCRRLYLATKTRGPVSW